VAKASTKKARRKKLPPLEARFTFEEGALLIADGKALRSAQYAVLDELTGFERNLKLWKKTGTNADDDLRELWVHEMRQVQRVMSYSGASDVIVDIIEFVEDEENFGVLLEHAGQPLSYKRAHVSNQHWMKNLGAVRSRALLWQNLKRVVWALGIIHAQGLVHGNIDLTSIMTEGADVPDFQLTGFEWSLRVATDESKAKHSKSQGKAIPRPAKYSFEEDWRSLGRLIGQLLDVGIRSSGELYSLGKLSTPLSLSNGERVLLKRLAAPARTDNLEAQSIARAIDDVITEVGRSGATRAGTLVLMFTPASKLGEAVFDLSGGQIAVDEYRRQLDWVRADLDNGAVLLAPKDFDPSTSRLQLLTATMRYLLAPFRQDGSVAWDIGVCITAEPRPDAISFHEQEEHELLQPVEVVGATRFALELRARLGPDVLDWSAFASPERSRGIETRVESIQRALLLIQVIEAVLKALEVYPIEIIEERTEAGRHFVLLRGARDNERDKIAKRISLVDTHTSLKRLFEDDHRDGEGKWRISQAASLGASRREDVAATFTQIEDLDGRHAYRFEIDEALPNGNVFFLRTEREAGTENQILRRLKMIKGLSTRIDLADMLDNVWRIRRSSRTTIDLDDGEDTQLMDLDEPKRASLAGLWETLPAYFVVGPPGVGKTKLATEVVRRRFAEDSSTRMLVTAQGHDALDHLQDKIQETLRASNLDLIVARSSTTDRKAGAADVQNNGQEILRALSESRLAQQLPPSARDRIISLAEAAGRVAVSKDSTLRDERIGLNAVSSLVLDAANVVVSTLNSPDIERLVEAHEQFDWVLVEEAAKAIGPELVGALSLSGRRLLIGDHHQLPPFEADRLTKILIDHSKVAEIVAIAEQYIGTLMRDGELAEINEIAESEGHLREIADLALRLLEPFRSVVVEDQRRSGLDRSHRPISSTLSQQRRMDPAIAEIVSRSFYSGELSTEAGRIRDAEAQATGFHCRGLPSSPVIIVDFPHVSTTGLGMKYEHYRPRFHNPAEVRAVSEILRRLRPDSPDTKADSPTLAVLSFYNAQVAKLNEKIDGGIKAGALAHLHGFSPAATDGAWASTVDGFQGNEADIVVLSLVRNNSGSGASALGFLRDRRRWNVALSRAKSKLVIVGSLAFLREAVRGVNPDGLDHDLSFLSTVDEVLKELLAQRRGDGSHAASLLIPKELGIS
jgi:hypothetical protein